jgi:hypothetical protein
MVPVRPFAAAYGSRANHFIAGLAVSCSKAQRSDRTGELSVARSSGASGGLLQLTAARNRTVRVASDVAKALFPGCRRTCWYRTDLEVAR